MRLAPVYRVTVFVPATHVDALIAGILAIDDLAMGDYRDVMWIGREVQEQFTPGQDAHPVLGTRGECTRVDSVRLEFSVPRNPARLERVLCEGVRRHHPWEVPAVFVDEASMPLWEAAK